MSFCRQYEKASNSDGRKLLGIRKTLNGELWRHLKGKQLLGYDFDRQRPIGNFIVDFFCNELMLAIEIDGESHSEKADQDAERQKILEESGVRFLRFADNEVKKNIEGVVAAIEQWIRGR